MHINKIIIGTIISLSGLYATGQELSCLVSVNSSQLQGSNKEIFNTLQESISDFMNSTVWTNHVFEINERIECNILINLTQEKQPGEYKGTMSIQARRPVYGSSYTSVMLNYYDENVEISYNEYDPLEFSENTHLNNLTLILAYYAYIIIGLDYDSFSPLGGTQYFLKAEKIVNNAQSSGKLGWAAFDSEGRKNRYWLVNNLLNEGYVPLREFIYTYHRHGLDVLNKSMEQGRLAIKDAITNLEKFSNNKPDPFMHLFEVVMQAKADEIPLIFSEAPMEDKQRIYAILTKADPANSSKYASLQQ